MKPTHGSWKDARSPSQRRLPQPTQAEPPRGTIAEWTITILLLLFGTTTLVQAFVIPTGSMEDTLLIGDHLLVDKLAYAPAGSVSKYILPYENPRTATSSSSAIQSISRQTFVKRVIGSAGRPHQDHQPAGLSQRREAQRAVRGSQESLSRFVSR